LIVEIAVATSTPPAGWRDESDRVLATVLDVLEEQAKAIRNGR
jgi:hypothetical protein